MDLALAVCPECGNHFMPNKFWQKYCSKLCNQSAYIKRKVEKKRRDPLDGLIPQTQASDVQEAERLRREQLADKQGHPLDEILEQALNYADAKPEPGALERLYGLKPDEDGK